MGVLIFTDDEALGTDLVAGASGVLLIDGDEETEVLDLPSSGEGVLVSSVVGPPGPPGEWVQVTQAEYDALTPPDPDTLYIVVG